MAQMAEAKRRFNRYIVECKLITKTDIIGAYNDLIDT